MPLAPSALDSDPLIELYKSVIDRTLIRENLRKSHEQRLIDLQQKQHIVAEIRKAGDEMRRKAR
jgi:hypothetical protein